MARDPCASTPPTNDLSACRVQAIRLLAPRICTYPYTSQVLAMGLAPAPSSAAGPASLSGWCVVWRGELRLRLGLALPLQRRFRRPGRSRRGSRVGSPGPDIASACVALGTDARSTPSLVSAHPAGDETGHHAAVGVCETLEVARASPRSGLQRRRGRGWGQTQHGPVGRRFRTAWASIVWLENALGSRCGVTLSRWCSYPLRLDFKSTSRHGKGRRNMRPCYVVLALESVDVCLPQELGEGGCNRRDRPQCLAAVFELEKQLVGRGRTCVTARMMRIRSEDDDDRSKNVEGLPRSIKSRLLRPIDPRASAVGSGHGQQHTALLRRVGVPERDRAESFWMAGVEAGAEVLRSSISVRRERAGGCSDQARRWGTQMRICSGWGGLSSDPHRGWSPRWRLSTGWVFPRRATGNGGCHGGGESTGLQPGSRLAVLLIVVVTNLSPHLRPR